MDQQFKYNQDQFNFNAPSIDAYRTSNDNFGSQHYSDFPPDSHISSYYYDEPSLLEELGVDFEHIKKKTLSVLFPFNLADYDLHMNDEDLTAPVIFGVILGFILALSGRLHFGYIYGISVLGCLSIYLLLNLMSESGLNFFSTVSILGYSLLPMDILALCCIFFPRKILHVIAALCIFWSTFSSSLFCIIGANLSHQRMLVAYPLFLFYATFAILAIF